MAINKVNFNCIENSIFPSEHVLSSISYKTSLGTSLKKSLSKVNKEELFEDLRLSIRFFK